MVLRRNAGEQEAARLSPALEESAGKRALRTTCPRGVSRLYCYMFVFPYLHLFVASVMFLCDKFATFASALAAYKFIIL
jgi:hypothetical protein